MYNNYKLFLQRSLRVYYLLNIYEFLNLKPKDLIKKTLCNCFVFLLL